MKAWPLIFVALFTAATALLGPVEAVAQGDGYLARVWDSTIKMPPGAYRAAKPIQLQGQFNITTSRWTLIDSVTFNGTQANQHWYMDGTIMQMGSIVGQLGIALDAKDCVFENCEMDKTGGWFVSMWGSNWRFDNCIFTRKFMRGDLPVGDYSVRAVHCTFYDLRLPTIGVKDDPGTYLQKERMGFVNCRFVRCDVPETFLAATVDCVFEDCHFPTKRQGWPEGMTPLKVNAMYSGLTDAPESFLNGPLSVRFTEAPMNTDAGTKLQHSVTGGEVTLSNYNPPLEYANLGSIPKRSSEMVPSGGDSNGIFDKPSGAAARPNGGAVDFNSFDDLVRGLPGNINLMTNDQPDIDGIDAANKWLSDHAVGRNAAFLIVYHSGTAGTDPDAAFRVVGDDEPLLFHGTTLAGKLVCLFPTATAGSLSGVTRGTEIKVLGVIKKVEIQGAGRNLALVVTLGDANLQ